MTLQRKPEAAATTSGEISNQSRRHAQQDRSNETSNPYGRPLQSHNGSASRETAVCSSSWPEICPGPQEQASDDSLGMASEAGGNLGAAMNRPEADRRREYILAEFRCAVAKAKLAQFDLEAAFLALKYNVVTAEQAVAMFWQSESIRFLGMELGSHE
jgi:hypothetical protein